MLIADCRSPCDPSRTAFQNEYRAVKTPATPAPTSDEVKAAQRIDRDPWAAHA